MNPDFILVCKATCVVCAIISICIFGVYFVYRVIDWAHHGSPPKNQDEFP